MESVKYVYVHVVATRKCSYKESIFLLKQDLGYGSYFGMAVCAGDFDGDKYVIFSAINQQRGFDALARLRPKATLEVYMNIRPRIQRTRESIIGVLF